MVIFLNIFFYANDGPATAVVGGPATTVISCSTDCTCKLWSLLDGTNLCKTTFPCAISGISLDPTETEFYAAGADGLIYTGFLKVGSRKEITQMLELVTCGEKHGGAIISVVVMMNEGKNLVSATEDGTKDRSKAIDMMESAVGSYEKPLELILKEAKGGTSRNSHKERGGM
ncbi:hypothetical protein NC652_028028 [Populus alba x Populus x berolinensis]|nr:hypothetical protein NC652_028028 [Populus alba x Populus x berolinensis]